MRTNNFFAKKKSAQAMVEFAIALPILLLLLYGILEAGRFLFLYSTVVTASRQAVRYGSATGLNDSGTPRYQDCDGIRNAANKAGYLGAFDTIAIEWDKGTTIGNPPVRVSPSPYCTGPTDTSLNTSILDGNATRIFVRVEEEFVPLVPKLVPFIQRTIVAESARTILYSVPIVVDKPQTGYYQEKTTTVITLDTPDPSETNQTVTVTVLVTGETTTPIGTVKITGADVNCEFEYPAQNSCDVIFTSTGAMVLTASYEGDTDHLPSSDIENHTVSVAETVTTVVQTPNPSIQDQSVVFTATVTGGITNPTGTVAISAGGNDKCTATLVNGTGSCTITFSKLGTETFTATYSGDSTHLASSTTGTHEILTGTATPSRTPTITPTVPTSTPSMTPTITITPTITATATLTPTAISNCGLVSHSKLTVSGNTMSMTIDNPTLVDLLIFNVFVDWHNDKGHQTGNDKTLKLQSATVQSPDPTDPTKTITQTLFTGNLYASSTTLAPSGVVIPSGTSTIIFTFHQSYDNPDNNEHILIALATNGCAGEPIDSGN